MMIAVFRMKLINAICSIQRPVSQPLSSIHLPLICFGWNCFLRADIRRRTCIWHAIPFRSDSTFNTMTIQLYPVDFPLRSVECILFPCRFASSAEAKCRICRHYTERIGITLHCNRSTAIYSFVARRYGPNGRLCRQSRKLKCINHRRKSDNNNIAASIAGRWVSTRDREEAEPCNEQTHNSNCMQMRMMMTSTHASRWQANHT